MTGVGINDTFNIWTTVNINEKFTSIRVQK